MNRRDIFFSFQFSYVFIFCKQCRDLKPENLLLTSPSDDADIKIVDFGFAIEIEGLNCTSQVGTPGYIAPEILNKVFLYYVPVFEY